jgi:hypothetical protein
MGARVSARDGSSASLTSDHSVDEQSRETLFENIIPCYAATVSTDGGTGMTAPFRIENQDKLRTTPPTASVEFRDYLGRLLKMIPAEVVGVYMIGAGIIPQTERVVSAIWAFICLGLVFLVRIYGTRDPDKKKPAQPLPVLIAAGAFVIWIYSQGGPFEQFGLYVPYIGSLAVLLWTFVIPIFYKGE